MRPIKLPFGLWLCRDTTIPADYPPGVKSELTRSRLAIDDLRSQVLRFQFEQNRGNDPAMEMLLRIAMAAELVAVEGWFQVRSEGSAYALSEALAAFRSTKVVT